VLSQEGTGLLPFHLPDFAIQLLFIGCIYAGPALAALVVTSIESGRAGVRQMLLRIVQWRVGIHWYIVALFGFLSIWLVAYSLILQGKPLINLIQNWPLLLSIYLPNIMIGIFIPSLGEELGWRGFALPRLQAGYSPLLGSTILGLLHGVWHLPIFFTQQGEPFTPVGFLAFVLTAIAGTYIYAWIFNHTRASILIAILIHAASNAANQLLLAVIPPDATFSPLVQSLVSNGWLNVIAFGTAALLLILLTKGRLAYAGNVR
jgi:membrane protease YdiL (CAAX protease family)